MGLQEDEQDIDKFNAQLEKSHKHVKFTMKDGMRYLGLPDSPVFEKKAEESPIKEASLKMSK